MKHPGLVFLGVLVFSALVAMVWAPSWFLGLGAGVLGGGVELGGGIVGGLFGIVGAILGVLAAIVSIIVAVPLALLAALGGILLAVVIVAAVFVGLASPVLVPLAVILGIVWLARRSGPRPPVPALPAPAA